MTPTAVLRSARALVAGGYTNQHLAERANGERCNPRDAHAYRFDLFGSLCAVWQKEWSLSVQRARCLLSDATRSPSLVRWSEQGHSQEDALAAFDRAIELAGETP